MPDDDEAKRIAKLDAAHSRLLDENERKYQMLQEKFRVGIPAEALAAKRFEVILDVLYPPNTEDRLKLEVTWQKWVQGQLEVTHSEVLEAQRAKPVVPTRSGLVLPGQN